MAKEIKKHFKVKQFIAIFGKENVSSKQNKKPIIEIGSKFFPLCVSDKGEETTFKFIFDQGFTIKKKKSASKYLSETDHSRGPKPLDSTTGLNLCKMSEKTYESEVIKKINEWLNGIQDYKARIDTFWSIKGATSDTKTSIVSLSEDGVSADAVENTPLNIGTFEDYQFYGIEASDDEKSLFRTMTYAEKVLYLFLSSLVTFSAQEGDPDFNTFIKHLNFKHNPNKAKYSFELLDGRDSTENKKLVAISYTSEEEIGADIVEALKNRLSDEKSATRSHHTHSKKIYAITGVGGAGKSTILKNSIKSIHIKSESGSALYKCLSLKEFSRSDTDFYEFITGKNSLSDEDKKEIDDYFSSDDLKFVIGLDAVDEMTGRKDQLFSALKKALSKWKNVSFILTTRHKKDIEYATSYCKKDNVEVFTLTGIEKENIISYLGDGLDTDKKQCIEKATKIYNGVTDYIREQLMTVSLFLEKIKQIIDDHIRSRKIETVLSVLNEIINESMLFDMFYNREATDKLSLLSNKFIYDFVVPYLCYYIRKNRGMACEDELKERISYMLNDFFAENQKLLSGGYELVSRDIVIRLREEIIKSDDDRSTFDKIKTIINSYSEISADVESQVLKAMQGSIEIIVPDSEENCYRLSHAIVGSYFSAKYITNTFRLIKPKAADASVLLLNVSGCGEIKWDKELINYIDQNLFPKNKTAKQTIQSVLDIFARQMESAISKNIFELLPVFKNENYSCTFSYKGDNVSIAEADISDILKDVNVSYKPKKTSVCLLQNILELLSFGERAIDGYTFKDIDFAECHINGMKFRNCHFEGCTNIDENTISPVGHRTPVSDIVILPDSSELISVDQNRSVMISDIYDARDSRFDKAELYFFKRGSDIEMRPKLKLMNEVCEAELCDTSSSITVISNDEYIQDFNHIVNPSNHDIIAYCVISPEGLTRLIVGYNIKSDEMLFIKKYPSKEITGMTFTDCGYNIICTDGNKLYIYPTDPTKNYKSIAFQDKNNSNKNTLNIKHSVSKSVNGTNLFFFSDGKKLYVSKITDRNGHTEAVCIYTARYEISCIAAEKGKDGNIILALGDICGDIYSLSYDYDLSDECKELYFKTGLEPWAKCGMAFYKDDNERDGFITVSPDYKKLDFYLTLKDKKSGNESIIKKRSLCLEMNGETITFSSIMHTPAKILIASSKGLICKNISDILSFSDPILSINPEDIVCASEYDYKEHKHLIYQYHSDDIIFLRNYDYSGIIGVKLSSENPSVEMLDGDTKAVSVSRSGKYIVQALQDETGNENVTIRICRTKSDGIIGEEVKNYPVDCSYEIPKYVFFDDIENNENGEGKIILCTVSRVIKEKTGYIRVYDITKNSCNLVSFFKTGNEILSAVIDFDKKTLINSCCVQCVDLFDYVKNMYKCFNVNTDLNEDNSLFARTFCYFTKNYNKILVSTMGRRMRIFNPDDIKFEEQIEHPSYSSAWLKDQKYIEIKNIPGLDFSGCEFTNCTYGEEDSDTIRQIIRLNGGVIKDTPPVTTE